jgi:pimeloyl-ACP methyl ester carboxylesterase
MNSIRRRLPSAVGAVLALCVALTTLMTISISPVAGAREPRLSQVSFPSGTRPTIVLVHGAWADSQSWSGVIAILQQDGYNVIAEPNPLRGLPEDSEYLADLLQSIKGPIVVVGHSYGGEVVTNAATGNQNVKALVYVDAFMPDQGESAFQLTGAKPGSCLSNPNPSEVFNFVPYPGSPANDVDLYVKPSVFATCFGNDLSPSQAAVAGATQRPLPLSAGSTPSGVPAWKTIPSWDVIGMIDKVIPPAEQLFMAQRAHSTVTEIHAGHLSMVSHPADVAKVIEQAAIATK